MNAGYKKNKGFLLLGILFLATIIMQHRIILAMANTDIDPAFHSGGIIPLTPGASTSVEVTPEEDWGVTTVICLGSGSLSIELIKDDTKNDLVAMVIMGFPSDPSWSVNVGVTPAKINASMKIEVNPGGFGTVLIFAKADSSESAKYKLSLKLTS